MKVLKSLAQTCINKFGDKNNVKFDKKADPSITSSTTNY